MQAAIQKLTTPPVIPGVKTPAQVATVKAPEMKLEQKPAEKPDKGAKTQTPNTTTSGKSDKKD